MAKSKKFGTFSGVFTPSILTILGVIMYLRFPAIIGQAGLINTIGIIVIAHIISITTGLSVASLSTDKPVQNGGTYFMISRSLGLPIGGTLGLALFVGLSFSVSLYLIGFAESFLQYWNLENNIQTIRITGTIILIVVTTITFISTSLAIKSQYFIMAAIILSLISIFFGFGRHDFAPTEVNFAPLATTAPFMVLFGIFFPAVTGFEAGVSMSGDLKDPKKSLPYGAMLAVGVGFVVYIGLALFYAFTVDSNALVNDPQILFKISLSPTLVIIGIWGATLSSALGSILGAPRILQAIAMDKIVGKFFAKGTSKTNEPRNALLVAFVIAEAGILIGELDVIARIVSMFFITTYAFLNLAAAIESWSSSDYRPAFKIPKFVSVLGALAAFIVMILLDFLALVGAIVVLGMLYFYLQRKELILESGDAWSSFWTNLAKKSLLNLTQKKGNNRNWRPNILLFSGAETTRPHLIEMGLSLTGKLGALTAFNLIHSKQSNTEIVPSDAKEKKQNHFTRDFHCESISSGIKTVSSVYGFSGFEPNTVLMGWSRDVQNANFLADIIYDLKSKNLNAAFLDYDQDNGFGKKQNIDIWWNGRGRFLSFALNILKFLSSDPSWRDAKARILIINGQTAMEDSIIRNTNIILSDKRINAEVKVINNDFGSHSREEIINTESMGADLLLLGISQNKSSYSTEYIKYINRLSNLPSSFLLLSPANEFDEISLFKNLQSKVKVEEFNKESSAIVDLPDFKSNIISNRIENLDADCMKLGRKFIDKSFSKVIGTVQTLELELKYIATQNKSSLTKEIEEGGKHNFVKIISRNHQLYLRKIAHQFKQRNEGLLNELKNDLRQSISELISGINNYIYDIPDSVTISYLANNNKTKEINFKYKKGLTHYVNTLVKPELKQQLNLLEEITVEQIVQTRTLLFGINDSYEKLEFTKGENFEETINGLHLQLIEFDALENNLIQFKKHTDSMLMQAFRNVSMSIGSDMDEVQQKGITKKYSTLKNENDDEYFASYAEHFGPGITLLNNTLSLDAYLLSIKTVAKNIIKSGNKKINDIISEKLLVHIDKLIEVTSQVIANPEIEFKPVQLPDTIEIQNLFVEAWNKITEIQYNFDEDVTIPEAIFDKNGNLHFSEYSALQVNLKKSSNYYLDTLFYEPYYRTLQKLENTLRSSIIETKEAHSLVIFNLNNQKNIILNENITAQTDQQIYNKLLQQIIKVKDKVCNEIDHLDHFSMVYLHDAFSKLFYHSIAESERKISSEKREQTSKKLSAIISNSINNARTRFSNFIVYLINSSSSGMLISRKYLTTQEKSFARTSDVLSLIEKLLPNQKTYNKVPSFYRNLMKSSSKINDGFWVPREIEIEKIKNTLLKHKRGFGGALLIKGVHGAGKTAISRYATAHMFKKKNIFWIDAPIGGSTDVEDFYQAIKNAVMSQDSISDIFNNMTFDTAIVINDLELWWERRTGGDEVLLKILELIQVYSNKIFFILNCNIHSFNIIKKLVPLEDNCLSIVECEPFNANELKELIISRHKSSGIRFNYKDVPEQSVSQLSLSLLFNSYFNTTKGIPGIALNTWKSNIVDTKDETILIKKPEHPNQDILLEMQSDWLIILSLFIQHKQMDEAKLVRVSGYSADKIKVLLLNLKNSGLIVHTNSKVLRLGRISEPLIVETCLTKGII